METKGIQDTHSSILILTDFSKSAKIAAEFGANLAAQLKADLLLFNSFKIPNRSYDSLPSTEDTSLPQKSRECLNIEVARLNEILQVREMQFTPKIDCISKEGSIVENVCTILQEHQNILMVVMGGCKINGHDDVLFGSDITEVLHKVKCPTLIVPE